MGYFVLYESLLIMCFAWVFFLINHLNNNGWRCILFSSAALGFFHHLQKQKIMNLLRDRKGRDEDSKENQSLPKDMIHDMMLCLPGKSIFRFKCASETLLFNTLWHFIPSQVFHSKSPPRTSKNTDPARLFLQVMSTILKTSIIVWPVDQCCKD